MKFNKIVSLLLIFCILFSIICVVTHAESETTSVNVDLSKLCALGILENKVDDLSRPVKRIEAVRYITALYGNEASYINGETIYKDVDKDDKYAPYVNFAYSKGVISPSEYFYPERTVKYEEAVKMIVTALGYKELADTCGGYPIGYINVATSLGILKNVESGEGHGVTLITCATLLDNALSAKVFNISLVSTKDGKTEYFYGDSKDGETVLKKRFSVSKYVSYINEINDTFVKAEIISKDKTASSDYAVGSEATFKIINEDFIDDCRYAIADVYADSEGNIVYLKNHKGTEIITDHILEINKSKNDAPNIPSMMETIAFENFDEYIDIAEDVKIFYDGKAIDKTKSYNFIGSFSRAVIYNDEVIALEVWNLTEGGLITSVSTSDIIYRKGDIENLELKNVASYKDVIIFVNGVKTPMYALGKYYIFDYFIDDKKETLLIVASSIAITDTFETVGTEGFKIGGDIYPASPKYDVYVSHNEKNFKINLSPSELLGRTVMAYLDSAGYVRFLRPVLDDEFSKEYFGIITGYNKEGLTDAEFSVYLLKDDEAIKGIYTLSETFRKNNSALVENIKGEIETLMSADDGVKNDTIKKLNLFYKIKVNDKGEITKITTPTRFSEPTLNDNYAAGTDGLLFNSSFTTLATAQIVTPKIYFGDAKFCLFYNSQDEGIKVDMVEWSELAGRACTNILITPFAEARSSEIDVVLLRGDAESLKITRGDYVKKGLCTDITIGYDKETESEVLNVKVDGKDYIVSKYKSMFDGVTDAAYILYSEGNSLVKNNELMPVTIFNLSGKPESWELSAERTDGIHRDEVDFIDSKRVYFKSGDVWYFGEDAPVYELIEKNGKTTFVKASRGSVAEGAQCFYIYQYYEVRALFFCEIN